MDLRVHMRIQIRGSNYQPWGQSAVTKSGSVLIHPIMSFLFSTWRYMICQSFVAEGKAIAVNGIIGQLSNLICFLSNHMRVFQLILEASFVFPPKRRRRGSLRLPACAAAQRPLP